MLERLVADGCVLSALRRSDVVGGEAAGWVTGDLSKIDALRTLVRGAETIIHIAGATTALHRDGFHTVNMTGTFKLVSAARAEGARHFILVSSLAARDPAVSPYAASKAGAEVAAAMARGSMALTIIRPPAVVGTGDPMLAPVFALLRRGILPAPQARSRKPQSFAIIDVDDLAATIVDQVRNRGDGVELLSPSSTPRTTWREVAEAGAGALGRPVRLFRIPRAVMLGAGLLCDLLSKCVRKPLPLSFGKARELTSADWTVESTIAKPTALTEIIAKSVDVPVAQPKDNER